VHSRLWVALDEDAMSPAENNNGLDNSRGQSCAVFVSRED
jgi:hypothetical protein